VRRSALDAYSRVQEAGRQYRYRWNDLWATYEAHGTLDDEPWWIAHCLEELEDEIWEMQRLLDGLTGSINRLAGNQRRIEKARALRNTTGRTPAEARAYRRKADELEGKR
jgi:hypothetical protein